MLEGITKGISGVIRNLTGKNKITEKNIDKVLDELKAILIDADVNYDVVELFLNNVKKDAIGQKIVKSITAREKFIQIVYNNLVSILGKESREPKIKSEEGQTIYLLAGLQGSGKTTTAAKIANLYREKRKVLMVAADIYRPAATDQLKILGDKINVEVYSEKKNSAEKIVKNALKFAKKKGFNLIIIDTAGRLQIDETLMKELSNIERITKPDEVFLVVDSMTGQVAADVAKEFKKYANITGVILSKFDSDTKGGAALSVKLISDVPIIYTGIGEKIEDIERFYPDRLAQRIIGMGDILSLVEKAEKQYSEQQAKKLEEKIKKNKFDLQDFLDQLLAVNKMGSLDKIVSMIPGAANVDDKILSSQQKKFKKYIAIIQSATKKERENPVLLNNPSRKKRIAKGSGTKIFDVQQLLNEFNKMKKMMKKMKGKKYKKLMEQFGSMNQESIGKIPPF